MSEIISAGIFRPRGLDGRRYVDVVDQIHLLECVSHEQHIVGVVFDEQNRTHGEHSSVSPARGDGL